MAALDLQEQEQLDALKGWWKDNGTFFLVSMLVLVLAVGGWRGWQYYQAKQSSEAVTLYESFLGQLQSGDAKRVNEAASTVMTQYGNTVYGAYAALISAQVSEENKDVTGAKTKLQWVIDNAKEDTLKDVARLRLASIWLDEKKFAEVAQILEAPHPAAFDPLYADMKGDLFAAQNKPADAHKSYKLAYDKLDEKSPYRNFVQMKMDDLGIAQ